MSILKKDYQQPHFCYSALARCVAWATLSVQVLFPLAVSFTPVMTAHAQNTPQPRLSTENTAAGADNSTEKNVASIAANTGTFLSSRPDSDATRSFVTGMATAKANQEIQEWLGKYGTARVKLNVDKKFALKDSSVEMLYPFYDTPSNMIFTQGAIHRTDDRTQSNIGFGWRHFSDNDWMAGLNTFIDHDFSHNHTRFGVGAEYWRDYLKLSTNGYIRASGWKKTPDIEDYLERPANGWDVRAEGYLPAYPQLGASLMYEQYHGDEVGLFGKDKRQKDPHAISAGINYTPIPLLTLSAEHKQGKDGQNDTRFGLDINYRIGEPLSKQLDTDNVRERRMLAGSRYDLVERNNNIVLEYQKDEVISIALPSRIQGKSGQTVSLGLVISKATHGLKRVQLEAPALLAAGGKITGEGSQWEIKFPPYKQGKDNRYVISATAFDTKGNASKQVQTDVVVTGAGINAERTTLTLGGQSSVKMLANGTEQMPLVLTLRDEAGQPATGMKDQIKTKLLFKPADSIVTRSRSQLKTQPVIGEFSEKGDGVYEAVFTTGTQSGEATIVAEVDGMSKSVNAELRATMMDVKQSTFKADNHSADVVADGLQSYTLSLKAVDADGNPVVGEASRLRFVPQDISGVRVGTLSEASPGVYTATISSTRAGKITVQVFSEHYQLGSLQETLTFVPGPVDAAHSTITLNPEQPTVGGKITAVWTAKDAFGNQVTDIHPDTLSITGDAAVGTSVSGWTVNGDGTWSAQISLGNTAGELIVMPQLDGHDAAVKAGIVTIKGDVLSSSNSSISATVTSLKAGESTGLTFVAKDKYGNALSGLSLSASLTGTAAEGAIVSDWRDHDNGSYSATLTAGGHPGELNIMPQLNGEPAANAAVQLTVVAGNLNASNSTVTIKDKSVAVGSTTTLTLSARDSFGNPITDIDVQRFGALLSGSAASNSSVTRWENTGSGDYQAVLQPGTKAGTLRVMPQVDGANAAAQAASVNVTGNASQADIRSTQVKVNNQLANAQSANVVVVTVQDNYENPLENQIVTLGLADRMTSQSGDRVTTDASGTASVELASSVAGERELTVSVNGHTHTVKLNYKADAGTAKASLSVSTSGEKVANGTDYHTLTANVRDKFENNVSGTLVTFNLPGGVKSASGTNWVRTNDEGNATLNVVSLSAGSFEVTASTDNGQTSQPQTVKFVADETTATITDVQVIGNRALANGQEKQTYKVTVKDANNNVLEGKEVTLSANSDDLVLSPANKAMTNSQGQAVFTGTTKIAQTYVLTASTERPEGETSTKTAEGIFVADEKNAELTVTPDPSSGNLVADGNSKVTFNMSLMAEDNYVGGTVSIDVEAPDNVSESDYSILPSKIAHFEQGKVTRTFSTRKPGVYTLTFSVLTYGGYEIESKTVTITAVQPDESEASIASK